MEFGSVLLCDCIVFLKLATVNTKGIMLAVFFFQRNKQLKKMGSAVSYQKCKGRMGLIICSLSDFTDPY